MLRLICACIVTCCLCVPAGAQDAPHSARQLRSTTKWGLDLLEEGCRKSSSFRRLAEALRETDLVVYVEPARQLPGVAVAVTEMIGRSGAVRYLRIWVGVQAIRKRVIAMVGHELQHALEIGRAPEVVDVVTLEAFYRRTGDVSVDGYDTQAARDAGDTIYAELFRPDGTLPARAGEKPVGTPVYPELTRR